MILDNIVAQICVSVLFLATVSLHLTKKNLSEAKLYCLQSLAVVTILCLSLTQNFSFTLAAVIAVMFVVKVVVTPIFFSRLIGEHKVKFTASTYVNMPVSMLIIAALLLLVGSEAFAPLVQIAPEYKTYLLLALATTLISIFLIVNRKGVMSQAIGVLSLENSIVVFAAFAGLEQSPLLQFGIVFDIFVWILLASVFVSMIYRHFGSLDVTNMKNLKG